MNRAKKMAPPDTTIITATPARAGVQSTYVAAQANTTDACVIRPSRRSVNWSAQTWSRSGNGLVSIWSSRPVRTCSADPLDAADQGVGDAETERRGAVQQRDLVQLEAAEQVEVAEHDPDGDARPAR